MPRISFCISSLAPSGAEFQISELAINIRDFGFGSEVVVLAPPPAENNNRLLKKLSQHKIPVTFLNATHKWQLLSVIHKMSRHFKTTKPGLIQCFLPHANIIGAVAGKVAGVPHVVSGIRNEPQDQLYLNKLAKLTERFVSRHVCVSNGTNKYARQVMKLSEKKLHVIPNGVELARFLSSPSPPLLNIEPNNKIVTWVGRLENQKRPLWMLDMMEQLLADDESLHLVVAGDGSLADQITRRVDLLRYRARIHILGYFAEIPRLLSQSYLLISTSAWEGMANVILEAMAAGKPVVATDVGGCREVLGDLVTHQIVPAHDMFLFRHKVKHLLKNEKLAIDLGIRNHQRVKKYFNPTESIERYAKLYHELIAK